MYETAIIRSSFFLDSLPEIPRAQILARSRFAALPLHTVLYEAEQTPSHAYFLISGMASVVTSMPNGSTVEVGVIGNEGFSGSIHVLGPALIPSRCIMQLQGSAMTIELPQLASLFANSPAIRSHMLEFVQLQACSLGQLAACHRLHLAEERLARWLLMVQDRVGSEDLELTQEFLSNMLGSRRTTVTKSAGILEQRGAIEYRRGHLRIINRKLLIEAACVCYPVIERLFRNLYGRAATSGNFDPSARKLPIC